MVWENVTDGDAEGDNVVVSGEEDEVNKVNVDSILLE